MDMRFTLTPLNSQFSQNLTELEDLNQKTARYGLILTAPQMRALVEGRFQALKATGRVEFGEGILKKLIGAFCDSPYLTAGTYENTLAELQDMFYYFKGEALERLSDDELIEAMRILFNGKAGGSLEYLSGTSLEALCRTLRGGDGEEPEEERGEDCDGE